jgi:hypothetical protein
MLAPFIWDFVVETSGSSMGMWSQVGQPLMSVHSFGCERGLERISTSLTLVLAGFRWFKLVCLGEYWYFSEILLSRCTWEYYSFIRIFGASHLFPLTYQLDPYLLREPSFQYYCDRDILYHCRFEGGAATVAETVPFVTGAPTIILFGSPLHFLSQNVWITLWRNLLETRMQNLLLLPDTSLSENPKTKKCFDRLRLHENVKSIREHS